MLLNAVEIRQKLLDKITKEIEEYEDAISSGSCNSYADYKAYCGHIRGLRLAEKVINDTVEELTEEEN